MEDTHRPQSYREWLDRKFEDDPAWSDFEDENEDDEIPEDPDDNDDGFPLHDRYDEESRP